MHELKPKIGNLNMLENILDNTKEQEIESLVNSAKNKAEHFKEIGSKLQEFVKKFKESLEELTDVRAYHYSKSTFKHTLSYKYGYIPYRVEMKLTFKVPELYDGNYNFEDLEGNLTLQSCDRINYINTPIESVSQCAAVLKVAKKWCTVKDSSLDKFHSIANEVKSIANKLPFIDEEFLSKF